MKTPCKYYRLSSNGFTLIEVVASLLLVGTLLVSVLMAHRRSAHQTRLAQQRLTAIAALDEYLTLRATPDSEFAGELQQPTGKIPGSNPYYWRSLDRYDSAAESIGALIQRIEVFHPEFDQGVTLSAVEMLMPGGRGLEASNAEP